jgi:plastocyanin
MRHVFVLLVLVVLSCGCVEDLSLSDMTTSSAAVSTTRATTFSSTSPTTTSTLAPVVALMVRIRDFGVHPQVATIDRGKGVSWLNDDHVTHNVAFSSFSSGSIGPGELYTHVFNETGSYDYYCSIHKRYEQGTVIVQ